MATFYITKYALTEGIRVVDAEVTPTWPTMISYRNKSGYNEIFHGDGRDWHRTREGANARAETMRQAKIASHKKSIAKLEKMTFGGEPA